MITLLLSHRKMAYRKMYNQFLIAINNRRPFCSAIMTEETVSKSLWQGLLISKSGHLGFEAVQAALPIKAGNGCVISSVQESLVKWVEGF